MDKFQFFAPSEVLFGKNVEAQVGTMCKKYGAHKVLVHFGGSSAKNSGLLDRVCASLKEAGLEYVLLGGVVPNPLLSKINEGVELCRAEGVDFILAVGGGSVIDCSKAVAAGAKYDGDVWDFLAHKAQCKAALPIVDVLTLAATGSEFDAACVISKTETNEKTGFFSKSIFPKVSILDPEYTFSVSPLQTAAGAADG